MKRTDIIKVVNTVVMVVLLTIGFFVGRTTTQPTVIKETTNTIQKEVEEVEVKVHTIESKGYYSNGRLFDDDGNIYDINIPNLTEDTRVIIEYDTNNTFDRTDDEPISVSGI